MAPGAIKDALRNCATALCAGAVALSSFSLGAEAARRHHHHYRRPDVAAAPARLLPYPNLALPLEIPGAQYIPLAWSEVAGWNDDDHVAAYKAFRVSCRAKPAQGLLPTDSKAMGASLGEPCRLARSLDISDEATAKAFFEAHFSPLRISRLGEPDGFVTGYYEPILEGSRTPTDVYNVPVYRRPSNLFVRGFSQDAPSLPNKGQVFRKIGRRKLVPYYDRGEIEDGAIAGRGLEICWLKSPIDLLFAQIQGSARIRLDDGSTARINYDAHNGYPYTAVGRILIERGIIPKEEMSMQRIRDWMAQNPDSAKDVRRQNRSYTFFREVNLSDKDEPVGAQGVPLTAGRSIAVDKSLHVYGTPFFIEGELPIDSEKARNPFHRLMIAQDTGSAIVGPARADLYFGAGQEAGRVSGRLRHNMHFVMLVPRSLDPIARGQKLPLPDPRPSETIAKLFPQTEPARTPKPNQTVGTFGAATARDVVKDAAKNTAKASNPANAGAAASPAILSKGSLPRDATLSATAPVPLPEARPAATPASEPRRGASRRHYRQP